VSPVALARTLVFRRCARRSCARSGERSVAQAAVTAPDGMLSVVLLTKVFSNGQFERALESWQWLDLSSKKPVLASLFGDVFFAAQDGWWYLSVLDGSLGRHWDDRDSLQVELDTENGQDLYLLGGLAIAAAQRGLTLNDNEIYIYTVPPVVGGSLSADNIETIDFVAGLSVLGQLHRRVRDMPPGSQFAGFTIGGAPP